MFVPEPLHEKALYPSVLGGGAQLLSILCLQRMAHVLLLSLFIPQTNCHTGSEVRHCVCACTHVCICASPIEPALHSAQRANFQEELTSACQLYLESLPPAVNTTAAWQLPEGTAAHTPAGSVSADSH